MSLSLSSPLWGAGGASEPGGIGGGPHPMRFGALRIDLPQVEVILCRRFYMSDDPKFTRRRRTGSDYAEPAKGAERADAWHGVGHDGTIEKLGER